MSGGSAPLILIDQDDGKGPVARDLFGAVTLALSGAVLPQPDGSTPTVSAAISGKLDKTAAALMLLLDALPTLPADPSAYPAQGGLFRDGDANGYRLVRIFPAS